MNKQIVQAVINGSTQHPLSLPMQFAFIKAVGVHSWFNQQKSHRCSSMAFEVLLGQTVLKQLA
jgi:hypothetical protein